MKKQLQLLFILLLCFVHTLTKAQKPDNDECSGAIQVYPSDKFSPTTSNLDSATSSDNNPDHKDVWYKFTAVTSAVKIITTQSSFGWKSFNYLYQSCTDSLLLQVDESASWGIRENLIPGNSYYYRYQAASNLPKAGETFSFGIVNLTTTKSNDLPAGRTTLFPGIYETLKVSDYLRGRHNVYYSFKNCNLPQADSTVIDIFFKFTANANEAYFTLTLDDSTWAAAMEIVDSSASGFLSNNDFSKKNTCFSTSTPTSNIRVYSLSQLEFGKTYNLRLEIGGSPTSPVGYPRISSPASNVSIVMNTLLSIKENPSLESVRLYPIPNNGSFTIEVDKLNTYMEITDLLGKKIYAAVLTKNKEEFNLSVQPGFYLVSLQNNSDHKVMKMEVK